jgi:hypothetical protein
MMGMNAGAPGAPAGMPAPPSAPASPMLQAGNVAAARLKVVIARKMLEAALPDLGAESDEGKAVVLALRPLTNIFVGEPQPGLLDSEINSMKETAAPTPAPAPAPAASPAPTGMAMGGPAASAAMGR